ncbi:MAG: ABC transporter ATP-binding protein/permease [Actinobacteria bacterium]|nr:ABC transporter ATP-binding protein/permease [Actinomycetota bacterium]
MPAPAPPPALMRRGLRLIGLALREAPAPFTVGGIGAGLYAGMTVLSAVVLGWITDDVVGAAFAAGEIDRGLLWLAVGALVGVGTLKATGVLGRRLGAYAAQYRLQSIYRRRVTRQYLTLPIEWHRRHSTGELLSNANADIESAFFIAAPLPMSFGASVMLIVTAVLLLLTDPFLAAIGFTVGPAIAGVNWYFARRMRLAAMQAQQKRADVSETAHESFDAAIVVKTLGREGAETERFRDQSEGLRDKMIEFGRLRAAFDPLMEALPNTAILAVLIVGAWRVEQGALSAGDLVQFAYLFRLVALPMRVFGWLLGELPRAVVGHERVEKVLLAEGEMAYGTAPGTGESGAAADFRSVGYQHPATVREALLPGATADEEEDQTRGVEEVSFDVAPGRTVAVVGPTGSGKSTIAALLVRLFDPHAGEVRFDGADLRDLGRDALSEHVSIVFQESFLFDDTVRGNITLGGDFSDEEVRWAAQLAQADGFIEALPDGYDTEVGERGATLSGGQKQRIALARALIRRPRLLVLDDATSSVDPSVESDILTGLSAAGLPSTVIVVAYRRSAIALADEVVFVREGTIAGRGTHAELLASDPAYANLVTAYDERLEGDPGVPGDTAGVRA